MAVLLTGGGKVPSRGKQLSDFAVGESVFLLENGNPAEYIVVNQGIPQKSSLYDSSCDGTWLLRKDIHSNQAWSSSSTNYSSSSVHSYLNNTFLNVFDADTQSAIKQVKMPYYVVDIFDSYQYTSYTGAKGVSTKVFLLGHAEVIGTSTKDGGKLDYFIAGELTSGAKEKRIAYLNGVAKGWWLRSPHIGYSSAGYTITNTGLLQGAVTFSSSSTSGVRPALILPSNALFDEKTLIFKGVK